jgi:predicted Fe-Mo cluster-binding NifX family protein
MKIAVASDNKTAITGHVGRCRGFLIYDVGKDKILKKEYRINSFTSHARGKHGSHHSDEPGKEELHRADSHKNLAEGLKDCQYLISHGMGRRLVDDLSRYNIKPIITSELNPDLAVIKLLQGRLENVEDLICQGHRKN